MDRSETDLSAISDVKARANAFELAPAAAGAPTTLRFIISRKGGFTNRLWNSVASTKSIDPEKPTRLTRKFMCFVEGPYTNEAFSFDSFSTLLFIAGGSGITHPLGHIRRLLTTSMHNLVAAQKIKLVWVVRDMDNVTWISSWLDELWDLDAGRCMFEVDIYVTRPSTVENAYTMSNVKYFTGRPQAELIIDEMANNYDEYLGAMSVNVCGPGGLADGVRACVRDRSRTTRIEFSEESFTWS